MPDQTSLTARKAKLMHLISQSRGLLQSYLSLLSGSLGRLVFLLIYFLALTNALSVAGFGVIAATSAMGVMLSRVAGLGFSSPLYRVTNVKPQLTGVYLAGYAAIFLLSLPLVAGLAYLAFAAFFKGELTALAFSLIIISEVVLWRSAEIMIVINNGLRRFSLGAAMTILGTFARMSAALIFWAFAKEQSVELWAWYYLAANAGSCLLISYFCRIKHRIRFVGKLYPRKLKEALSVSATEIIFYAQMELDKVLMLALAGGEVTGIYAVIMRLVDLTAIPLRAFNTLLVQSIMRTQNLMASWRRRIAVEGIIIVSSTMLLAAIAILLWIKPTLLGSTLALASPVLFFALTIPATRNLIEYHSELLYARGQTASRMGVLALIGALKALLMSLLIYPEIEAIRLIIWMSIVFAGLYLVSASLTYGLMRETPIRA